MGIFDLHTHVLPGVDDGARCMEDALQMLRNAVANDVTHLAVTPHYNSPRIPGPDVSSLQQQFQQLQEAAREIPVTLFLGAEVHINSQPLPPQIPTLNGSRYLLTELPQDISFEDGTGLLQPLLEKGYTPIIAHPERYTCICQNPGQAVAWLDLGCHLQVTGGSILGKFGKLPMLAARALLQQDLVACVASDAHGPHARTNYLADVYNHLYLHFNSRYAQTLMWENPQKICNDQPLA